MILKFLKAAVFGLALGAAAPAFAVDLFSSDSVLERTAPSTAGAPHGAVIAARLVNVDREAVASALLPEGADRAANRASRAAALSEPVTISLFDGLRVTLKRQSVEESLSSGIVWNGAGADGAEAILVVNRGKITGVVDVDGRKFLIDPVKGAVHRLREVTPAGYPSDLAIRPRPQNFDPRPSQSGPQEALERATTTTITLYAVYTKKAKASLGSTAADKIALDVAITNKGMANSKVPIKIKLLGVKPVATSYNDSGGNPTKPLNDITNGKIATFKAVHAKRNSLKADLVTLYAMRPEYCGVAWLLPKTQKADAKWGFSVITADCTGLPVLAHELGHNMGLRHDRFVEDSAPKTEYNFGYINMTGKFRDIMSYSSKCDQSGVTCEWLTYYSSPLIKYKGLPFGIAAGKTGAADAARALRENRKAVASFR